jgi:hypothetical protein
VILAEPRVSSEHAAIAWRDGGWWVRDLASRNGTTLGGEPVQPGLDRPLALGSALAFAQAPCTLVDDGAPSPAARDLATGALHASPGEVLGLPDDAPIASIAPAAEGWRLVLDDDERPIADRDEIEVAGRRYRVYLPVLVAPTMAAIHLALTFAVSADEERVSVELAGGGRRAALRPRSHLYLLLTLARARLASTVVNPLERGWVHRDDLARMLRCDPSTVNVQLHRLRQDLAAHGIDGAAGALEARPRTGQVRLGTEAIEIRRAE